MSKVKVNAAVLDFDIDGKKILVRDSKEAVVGFLDLDIEEISARDKNEEELKQTILENIEVNNVENGTKLEISSEIEKEDDEREEKDYDVDSHEDDMLL